MKTVMKKIVQLSLVIIVLFVSCKKFDPGDDPCPYCPKIDSLVPSNGGAGSVVKIYGRNFNSDYTKNIIKFNGVLLSPTEIVGGNTTVLSVFVPNGCGSGPVTVDVDEELTYAGTVKTFIYTKYYRVDDYSDPIFNNLIDIAIDSVNNIYVLDSIDNTKYQIFKCDSNKIATPMLNVSAGGFTQADLGGSRPSGFSIVDQYIYITNSDGKIYRVSGITPGTISPNTQLNSAQSNFTFPANSLVGLKRNVTGLASTVFYTAANKYQIYAYYIGSTIDSIAAGTSLGYTPDAGYANSIPLWYPKSLVFDNYHSLLFIHPAPANCIMKYTLPFFTNDKDKGYLQKIIGINNSTDQFNSDEADDPTFSNPQRIACDIDQNIYILDKTTTNGTNLRVANYANGNYYVSNITEANGDGYVNGEGSYAKFTSPTALVVDVQGNIYISDKTRVRKVIVR